jgi:hypothetical protein
MDYLKRATIQLPRNLLFQIIMAIIFIIPAIETIGQYISSGFMKVKEGFPIIFWPGTKVNIFYSTYVWISMSIMVALYIIGIIYLIRKKEFGIVTIVGIIGVSVVGASCFILANKISNMAVWIIFQGMSSSNSVDRSLFSLWSNPLWEEIVFRGIPLVFLLSVKKKLSVKKYKIATILYFLIPSIFFSIYHIPNHGTVRIPDTFVIGLVFAYLALRYSLFAPLVIHYFVDAQYVITILNNKNIPNEQVVWLAQNGEILNRIYYGCFFSLIVVIPSIIIWNVIKLSKTKDNYDRLNI